MGGVERLAMKELKIRLKNIEEVKRFVQIVSKGEGRAELYSDCYEIDAKSILGVFSLDLTKTLSLRLYHSSVEMEDSLRPYRVIA